jgi:hypothetical protein
MLHSIPMQLRKMLRPDSGMLLIQTKGKENVLKEGRNETVFVEPPRFHPDPEKLQLSPPMHLFSTLKCNNTPIQNQNSVFMPLKECRFIQIRSSHANDLNMFYGCAPNDQYLIPDPAHAGDCNHSDVSYVFSAPRQQ